MIQSIQVQVASELKLQVSPAVGGLVALHSGTGGTA